MTSPTPPAHALRRIFQNNSSCSKLVADLVRARKVSISACFLAFLNQSFDLTVQNVRFLFPENSEN
jgi:hypothetical protein